ncbi:MAG TPA: 50S ribosomal protein L11 methyltransferase [Sphingomonas sp.]|nr:50S ribosomal protein L11 methyltransferase [Sphingomonas sp.]
MDKDHRLRGFEALAGQAAGNPDALAALSLLFSSDGWKSRAAEIASQVLALPGGGTEARTIARHVIATDVPSWHFVIVTDLARNLAYDEALQRAVKPGSRVLEIGTGSGLLAMMAARAGAAHVYTCEMEPAVAIAAREVIARNGFSDRITVISKHSKDVDPAELGGPVDILVSEIVSNEMLGEGVLPAMEDAIGRLVKPGGAIIPARGTIRIALAHLPAPSKSMGMVSGFDLSPFDDLREPNFRIHTNNPRLTLCSEATDLFAFDFTQTEPWQGDRAEAVLRATGEPANGLVQWITLDMDGVGSYENRPSPDSESSAWAAVFHTFERMLDPQPEQPVRAFGQHDMANVRLWIDPPA